MTKRLPPGATINRDELLLLQAKAMSEATLQSKVLKFAKDHGWLRAHFRPARTKDGGWRTPVQGDGAGFPDLILLRRGQLVVVELKSQTGRVEGAQGGWLYEFGLVGSFVGGDRVLTFVWRPLEWLDGTIEEVLL